jgi:hypothetical protein
MAPMRKKSPVHGIRRSRPPKRSICRVPVAITTLPAPRNRSPLKIAWFNTCVRLAAAATAASSPLPLASAIIEAPSPRTMIPTFSMVL